MQQRRRDSLVFAYRRSLCFLALILSHFGKSTFAFVHGLGAYCNRQRAPFLSTRETSINEAATNVTMIVVFGRAGAGKTTVASVVVELLSAKDDSIHCVGLDLDVCVPTWMRENFGKGIYPTLKERTAFALDSCDYIDTKLREQAALSNDRTLVAVVSFSFVNTDLRDVFRSRFPNAMWALVDTTQSGADERICKREGHFYKGVSPSQTSDDNRQTKSRDNTEWEFAPVTFPHIVLPGSEPIEVNAQTLFETISQEIHKKQVGSNN